MYTVQVLKSAQCEMIIASIGEFFLDDFYLLFPFLLHISVLGSWQSVQVIKNLHSNFLTLLR